MQVRQTLDEPGLLAKWPLVVEIGDPGSIAARVAGESGADLIVVGLGAPERRQLRVGGTTALCVARYATAPLFAAMSGCELPASGIVPIVDGHLHVPTLRATAACLLPGGRLVLSYFGSARHGTDADSPTSVRHIVQHVCGAAWKARLDQLDIARVDMEGDATAGALRLAEDSHADLIAVPNYGAPGPVRAFVPNLADSLLLGARCSVLVVPDWADETVHIDPGISDSRHVVS
jgi:nucleotide-binding universal stress UspA family protein